MSEVPALAVEGLSKTFGGQRALADFSLTVGAGEVVGLVGKNGSGKSTLIKLLSGYYHPDPGGRVLVSGKAAHLPLTPHQVRSLGLSFVQQDLGLLPDATVLENACIGRFAAPPLGRIRWGVERAAVVEALGRVGLRVSPQAKVGSLAPVSRSLVAIARALLDTERHSGSGLLVLDEPTAFLPRDGVERLFLAIRRIAASGTAVLFVSHRLAEVLTLCDRIAVLRDGRLVSTLLRDQADEGSLVHAILGRRPIDAHPVAPRSVRGAALVAHAISGRIVDHVDFVLRTGEVLGLTGLAGMGHEEVPYLLFGAAGAPRGGHVTSGSLIERPLARLSPRRAMRAGLAMLPADRQGASGVGAFSVRSNITLPIMRRFYRRGVLHHKAERNVALGLLRLYQVVPALPERLLGSLSGGNQQKALLAKWLQRRPNVLILHEPTQGVDVGAKQEILRHIHQLATEGGAVLVCSTEYEDLSNVCDRVLVFRDGRITSELWGEALTSDRVIERCYMAVSAPQGPSSPDT